MYKNLSIVLLLAAFGLVATRSTGAPASTLTSPMIFKRVVLKNQTAPIPPTTLFTPPQTGLYRISAYMTQIVPTPGSNGQWSLALTWSDDAGLENSGSSGPVSVFTGNAGYGSFEGIEGPPGGVAIIEAVAGQPVSFSVDSGGGGTYSCYFVIERLV